MKKSVSIFISFCILISCISTAYACTGNETQGNSQVDQIEYLINAGLPYSYLERRTPQEINTLFDLAQTHTLEYSPIPTSTPFGTISPSALAFNVEGVRAVKPSLPGQPSLITNVLVTVDYQWYSGHPLVRAEDAISINWDSNLFALTKDTFSSVDYHLIGSTKAPVNSQPHPATTNQGGLGYYVSLFNTSPNPVVYSGNAGFMLTAKMNLYHEEEYSSNQMTTTINGIYTHNTNPLGLGLSFNLGYVGVSVAPGPLQDSVSSGPFEIRYSMPN